MEARFNFVEINYHSHKEISEPRVVIQKHLPSNLFAQPLLKYANVTLVKHMDQEGEFSENGIHYRFYKRSNRFFQIPFRTHRAIKELKPDLVLVQGFIFPVQVTWLRKKLGKNTVILLQYRGESPVGKKKIFQKWVHRYVDGYVFSSIGNAEEWIEAGVIKDRFNCFELPSSSTVYRKQDKQKSREQLKIPQGTHFLWVGRLNKNKDPVTVLRAFQQWLSTGGDAYLWMIYDQADMETEISIFIAQHAELTTRVRLIGKLPHAALESWYSAADYFISASWKEGGSFSLTEAMACGCVPIVSNIPPSMQAIDNGNAGYYFEKGNYENLFNVLSALDHSKLEEMSLKVINRFMTQYSAEAVAEKLVSIYRKIIKKEP